MRSTSDSHCMSVGYSDQLPGILELVRHSTPEWSGSKNNRTPIEFRANESIQKRDQAFLPQDLV